MGSKSLRRCQIKIVIAYIEWPCDREEFPVNSPQKTMREFWWHTTWKVYLRSHWAWSISLRSTNYDLNKECYYCVMNANFKKTLTPKTAFLLDSRASSSLHYSFIFLETRWASAKTGFICHLRVLKKDKWIGYTHLS